MSNPRHSAPAVALGVDDPWGANKALGEKRKEGNQRQIFPKPVTVTLLPPAFSSSVKGSQTLYYVMHSLEADGPELQALDAIRSLIVPLVEKRIDEGTENAKSLAVRNSLDLLRFEMSSLLFWITKGHQLNDEDHGTFLQDLQPVLQLLEELIDPQIVGRGEADIPDASSSTEQRRYPRLHALIQKASQGSTQRSGTKFDLAEAISLPDSEDPARAAYETVTNFNANNQRRDHGAHTQPSPTQPDQNSSGSHAENACIRQSKLYTSMFKAWAHHFSVSGCHTHRGKLQACAFELNDPGPQDSAKNNMFISPCDPENRWQEVTCAAGCNLNELSSSLCEIGNICQIIGDSLSDQGMLSLWIRSEKFWHDPEADLDLARQRHVSPTFSLDRILRQPIYELGPNRRVNLAYSLACTLARIYSADMQQQKWGPRGIYFLYNSEQRDMIHEVDYPYVECTFSSDGTLVLSDETLVLRDGTPVEIKDRFPLLIYFAKLLLEIGLGRLFVPEDRRIDVQLTKWAQSDEAQESLIRSYFDAIMECLRAKKPRYVEDPADEEIRCRKAIFNLVSHLNKARQSYRPLDPRRTQEISMLDSTISEPTVDHEPPQQEPLLCEDLLDLLPKNRMFDEQKLRFCNNDQSDINSAKDFLDRAETFYTSSVRGLTSNPDIRIAILDTGIQTLNSFIRGVKNSRRGRDSPIKQSTSFVSKHPDDECGHGTNVASLILRIFPEANLYIAKIARNLEQDGVSQIVEAIKWARSFNVRIINMSFSIPKTPAVKRIIRDAEKDGVIVFVAASNNGANTGRSFPATLGTVLCIHATDGKGNKGGMNPEPEPNRENLSTLGVAVPSVWENGVYLSGTSYATPVGAAIAAVILCCVKAAVAANELPEEIKEDDFDREGMRRILMSMTVLRDGYNCILPWRNFLPAGAEHDVLIESIRNALN